MDTKEDDPNWMEDYEPSEIVVSDLDLLTALDHLDSLDPKVHQEEWYRRLSDSLDKHLKPKLSPTKH